MPGSSATLSDDAPLPAFADGRMHRFLDALRRLPGRILLSWSMAGGVIAGGLLIAATTLTGRMSSSSLPQLSLVMFFLGAAAGIAHGGLLGYLSRNPERTRTEVIGVLGRTLAWVIPALLVSWVATLWIALTASVLQGSGVSALAVVALFLSWLYGMGVCAWAGWEGLLGLIAAYRRWPDLRVASLIISVVFGILMTLFLSSPPEIWFTNLRVSSIGAVILAFGASVWIALPVVIAGLGLFHRVRDRRGAGE